MKKFGGWLRLWIVVAVATFSVTMAIIFGALPRTENAQHTKAFYEQIPPELRKNIIEDKTATTERRPRDLFAQSRPEDLFVEDAKKNSRKYFERKMPNGHIMVFTDDITREEMEKTVAAYWNVVEKITFNKRIYFVLPMLFCWAFFIMGLYAVGWSIGWVYRGFRDK